MDTSKIIFHLDMDSFFVSAARTVDHSLKNKPVAVANSNRRAITTSVSYEAKALGVQVAKPVYQAKFKCPELIIVAPDFNLYNNLSSAVFDYLVDKYPGEIQISSIDEAYLDVTNIVEKDLNKIYLLAKKIQNDVLAIFDLPLSIGVGHNLFNAKMSTPINKPLGITITKPSEFAKKFHDMDINDFHGIGYASVAKLRNLNINKIGQFCNSNFNDSKFEKIFGNRLETLKANCNGTSTNEIDELFNILKGIGNSETFEFDKDGKDELIIELKKMIDRSWKRMEARGVIPQIITISTRSIEKKWSSKQHKFSKPIKTIEQIYDEAIKLFEQHWYGQLLRGIGIRFNEFVNQYHYFENSDLFLIDDDETTKIKNLISQLNKKQNQRCFFQELNINKIKHYQNHNQNLLKRTTIIKKSTQRRIDNF